MNHWYFMYNGRIFMECINEKIVSTLAGVFKCSNILVVVKEARYFTLPYCKLVMKFQKHMACIVVVASWI